jgi:Trk K+ transport system NAD-binding subunit
LKFHNLDPLIVEVGLVDLRNVTMPHLASLLRHGTPIPIHGGQGELLTVNVSEHSQLADRVIADVFEQFPDLLAVAIIRDQRVELPRGSTRLQPKDQLLIVTNETKNLDAFIQLASGKVNKAVAT